MTTEWRKCSDPPTREGWFWVQCLFPDGEPLTEPELLKWEGKWIGGFGLEVMPYDRYRAIEGEKE